MRWVFAISVILFGFYGSLVARAEMPHVFGAGPAADPDSKPDWGGTPDVVNAVDVGLSKPELEDVLTRLGKPDAAERSVALEALMRDAEGSEAVFRDALFDGRGLRNTEMKAAVKAAAARGGGEDPASVLKGLAAVDPPSGEAGGGVRGAMRVVALLSALSALDTLAGYKAMIEFSPRHAGVFRRLIGEMLVSHKMDVMPALVYGRGSKDKEIHMSSVKWIRDLGDPLLSDQVKIENPRRLSQLLEAYASVNDLDTIDVVLSFTNHASAFVRAAARGSVAAFGRNAFWPARRQYEITFGQEPDDTMDVDAILTALYKHYDERRLAESRELFALGKKAFAEGRLQEMETAYLQVLKKEPMFPRRAEMAEGFAALAETLASSDAEKGRQALMMVVRTADEDSPVFRSAKAHLMWYRQKNLRDVGLAGPEAYQQISNLDPSFGEASAFVAELTPKTRSVFDLVKKALIVSILIFTAGILIIFRLRGRSARSSGPV